MKGRWLAHCFRWKRNILIILLGGIALLLTLSRIFIVVLADHREFVESWVSRMFEQPVQIQQIKANWFVMDPGITFRGVLVKNRKDQQPILQIKRLTLRLDILRSLLHWRIIPGHLILQGMHVDIDQDAQGHLQVRGILSTTKRASLSEHSADFKTLLLWLIAEGNVLIKEVSVNYHTADQSAYLLQNVVLHIKNSFFKHSISGLAVLKNQSAATQVRFAARLSDINFFGC